MRVIECDTETRRERERDRARAVVGERVSE